MKVQQAADECYSYSLASKNVRTAVILRSGGDLLPRLGRTGRGAAKLSFWMLSAD